MTRGTRRHTLLKGFLQSGCVVQEHLHEQDEDSTPVDNKCMHMNGFGVFLAKTPFPLLQHGHKTSCPGLGQQQAGTASRTRFVLQGLSSAGGCLWAQLGMKPVTLRCLARLTSPLIQLVCLFRTHNWEMLVLE